MQPILKDKTILVAGGSQGLGYAIAEASAREGANVFIGSRNAEKLSFSASQIAKSTEREVQYGVLDVTKVDSIKEWVNSALEKYGKIAYPDSYAGAFVAFSHLLFPRYGCICLFCWWLGANQRSSGGYTVRC